jgi:hypothetical protein
MEIIVLINSDVGALVITDKANPMGQDLDICENQGGNEVR